MIHKICSFITFIVAVVLTASCADMNTNYSKEQIGKVGGATVGAILGYNLIGSGNGRYLGAAVGGLAGYLAGKVIGKNMDNQDQERLIRATDHGLGNQPGQMYRDSWKNGSRSYETRVTPQDSYVRRSDHQWCKHFTQETTVITNGNREVARQDGVGCYDTKQNGWVVQAQ